MKVSFDDESMIRIFVRIRQESKENTAEAIIFSKILLSTSYRLPLCSTPSQAERVIIMNRVVADVEVSTRNMVHELKMQFSKMRIRVKVLPGLSTTIIYQDTITGKDISYKEYESRYFSYISKAPSQENCTMPLLSSSPPGVALFIHSPTQSPRLFSSNFHIVGSKRPIHSASVYDLVGVERSFNP